MLPDELAQGGSVGTAALLGREMQAWFSLLAGKLGGLPGTALESDGYREDDRGIRIPKVPLGPLEVSSAWCFL